MSDTASVAIIARIYCKASTTTVGWLDIYVVMVSQLASADGTGKLNIVYLYSDGTPILIRPPSSSCRHRSEASGHLLP